MDNKKTFTINLFVVKYKGEIIQVEGIVDEYTPVQILPLNNINIDEVFKWRGGEARDLCGEFGDFEISIIEKIIEL